MIRRVDGCRGAAHDDFMSSSTTRAASARSDAEVRLIELAKASSHVGREQAIQELFHLYYDRLVRMVTSRGYASQAEDFIMDAWTKLIPGVRSGDYEPKYELLHTTVMNRLRDEAKSARQRKTGAMVEEPLDRRGMNPEMDDEADAKQAKFDDCMTKMSAANEQWAEVLRRCLIPEEVETIRDQLGLKDSQAVYNRKRKATEFMTTCVQGGAS